MAGAAVKFCFELRHASLLLRPGLPHQRHQRVARLAGRTHADSGNRCAQRLCGAANRRRRDRCRTCASRRPEARQARLHTARPRLHDRCSCAQRCRARPRSGRRRRRRRSAAPPARDRRSGRSRRCSGRSRPRAHRRRNRQSRHSPPRSGGAPGSGAARSGCCSGAPAHQRHAAAGQGIAEAAGAVEEQAGARVLLAGCAYAAPSARSGRRGPRPARLRPG